MQLENNKTKLTYMIDDIFIVSQNKKNHGEERFKNFNVS